MSPHFVLLFYLLGAFLNFIFPPFEFLFFKFLKKDSAIMFLFFLTNRLFPSFSFFFIFILFSECSFKSILFLFPGPVSFNCHNLFPASFLSFFLTSALSLIVSYSRLLSTVWGSLAVDPNSASGGLSSRVSPLGGLMG